MYTIAKLSKQLQNHPGLSRYWLGFSGGMDSSVLLHSMARLGNQLSGVKLIAIHIHHGLHPDADRWVSHCQAFCAQLNLDLVVKKVAVVNDGCGWEAAARRARYRGLCTYLQAGDALITAHHQQDQAETLLLQLLRGSGPVGLAAMPAAKALGMGMHLRPLLVFDPEQLMAYAQQHRLHWIEDSSNADCRFDRNYLRHEIIPRLRRRWPAVTTTMARTARHCAQNVRLTTTLAERDWQQCRSGACLELEMIRRLTPDRRVNLLRFWLQRQNLPLPNEKRMLQICGTMLNAAIDRQPLVHWLGAEIRCYRQRLYAMSHQGSVPADTIVWQIHQPCPLPTLALTLFAKPALGGGLKQDLLVDQMVEIRFRQGGEICQIFPNKQHKRLKKLFQEHAIPPWRRARLPLIYVNHRLAAVADLWVCEPFTAQPGELGWRIHIEQSTFDL